ncbi:PREDICTED: uncharacterized protein LOC108765339 [Trachymyrmex cornetzi]|uniref:uncharacterized protein LOC108765339 n=1 Tax=Trachymyrmex cornetzi TaxID=471704 RepID=UPI00084EEB76|nr:PREDICTED: uncharacterized protein LOC108765339 [Trachymyrmex cornetzi]
MMSLSGLIYGLWLLCLFASLIFLSLSNCIGSNCIDVSCCPEGTLLQYKTHNCSDDTHIRPNCSGMYMLNPQKNYWETFTVIYEKGTALLQIEDIKDYKVPFDR